MLILMYRCTCICMYIWNLGSCAIRSLKVSQMRRICFLFAQLFGPKTKLQSWQFKFASVYLSICLYVHVCVCAPHFCIAPRRKCSAANWFVSFTCEIINYEYFPNGFFFFFCLLSRGVRGRVCACVRENSGIGELCEYICR